MEKALSLYLALSGKSIEDFEFSAVNLESNEDCAKLNLLCPCCHERVYLSKSIKGKKFFSHWPNSPLKNCENRVIYFTKAQKQAFVRGALEKIKADYAKHFWKIINSVYAVFQRIQPTINIVKNEAQAQIIFEELFYPKFFEKKQLLEVYCETVLNSSQEFILEDKNNFAEHDLKVFQCVLLSIRKSQAILTAKLLIDFLMQKRSKEIIKQFYFFTLALHLINNDEPDKWLAGESFIYYSINIIMSVILWCPWEYALEDIKCFGEVKPKHCYSSSFDMLIIKRFEIENEIKPKPTVAFKL